MDFTRKKLKGQNQKVRRTWLSPEQYRITWRSEAFGIAVLPRYQATVRIELPQGGEMWDHVAPQRLIKTLKAAKEAIEKHYRRWSRAINASGSRALTEIFGTVPIGIPKWAKDKLNHRMTAILMDRNAGKRCDFVVTGPTQIFEPTIASSSQKELGL